MLNSSSKRKLHTQPIFFLLQDIFSRSIIKIKWYASPFSELKKLQVRKVVFGSLETVFESFQLFDFKVAKHSFGSLWLYVICQIMARERLLLTSWKLASEKCTDERFWLTGKSWRFPGFHGNMNDWIQP